MAKCSFPLWWLKLANCWYAVFLKKGLPWTIYVIRKGTFCIYHGIKLTTFNHWHQTPPRRSGTDTKPRSHFDPLLPRIIYVAWLFGFINPKGVSGRKILGGQVLNRLGPPGGTKESFTPQKSKNIGGAAAPPAPRQIPPWRISMMPWKVLFM